MYSYFAYGLSVRSELYLPELLGGRKKVDVEIKRGKLDTFFRSRINDERCYRITDSEVFCSYINIGSFLIIQGREIIVDPAPGVDEQLLRPYLLGTLGILLYERGFMVLHGSAVVLDGEAVAFLGPSGCGKSTAAASLGIKGHSIIADDVVAIDTCAEVPVVYPSFPQLNLLPEAADSLGFDLNTLPRVSPMDNKRAARLDSCFSLDPVPLRRIYLLENGESTEIQRLGPRDSTIELLRRNYPAGSLITWTDRSSFLLQCAKIARDVPICRLVRPFDLKGLANFANAVEDDVRRNCRSRGVEIAQS